LLDFRCRLSVLLPIAASIAKILLNILH